MSIEIGFGTGFGVDVDTDSMVSVSAVEKIERALVVDFSEGASLIDIDERKAGISFGPIGGSCGNGIYHDTSCYDENGWHDSWICPNTKKVDLFMEPPTVSLGIEAYFIVGGRFEIILDYQPLREKLLQIWGEPQ